MGKKMKLPLVFKSTETTSLWPWVICNQAKTHSFRANNNPEYFKTMNTVYINTPDLSYSSGSLKPIIEENGNGGDAGSDEDESVEMVIKGLSSERFFIEVSGETSSILEEANNKKDDDGVGLFQESVAMEMESRDPFVDFRRSMEEMMEANHGLIKDNWDFLEELLACYLKVNHKSNHGYIVGAFMDLVVGLEFSSATTNADSLSQSTFSEDQCRCSSSSISGGGGGSGGGGHSFTSPLSFYSSASSTSRYLSSLMESEDEKSVGNGSKSSSSLVLSNV